MKRTASSGVWRVAARLILISLTLLATGCYRIGFVEAPGGAQPQSRWQHHYLLGLVGGPEVDTRDLCPNGTAEVVWSSGVLVTGLTLITLGIYTPRELHVRCRAEP